MPLYQTALSRVLPPGSDAYLALLTTPPDASGVGEVEASYAGYARQLHTAWASHKDGDVWYQSNAGSIVFPAVAGSAITVSWWGLYLVSVGGDLMAAGPILNLGGVEYPQILLVGDQARFLDDSLKIRSGD